MRKFIKYGLILTGALSLFLLSGCNGGKKLDISNCIENRITGFDGYAKFDGKVDYEKLTQIPTFQNKLTEEMLKGDYKIKLVADKTTELKNGEKIKLSLDYNKEIYKRDFGVELEFEPKEIEVKNLRKVIEKKEDMTDTQWESVINNSNEYMLGNKYENLKLLKIVISYNKNNVEDKYTIANSIEFIYSIENDNKVKYVSSIGYIEPDNDKKLIDFVTINKYENKPTDGEIKKEFASNGESLEIIDYKN